MPEVEQSVLKDSNFDIAEKKKSRETICSVDDRIQASIYGGTVKLQVDGRSKGVMFASCFLKV